MSRRALPVATDRREGVRGALLHTLPGRAIVIGLGVKIAVAAIGAASGGVSPFLSIIDSVATIAAAIGIAVFAFRLVVLAKRRLLWRVRRKLILSYIFIGFVPALLIVAFFVLCGFLLFYSFSSYLVQNRLRALNDQARFIATATVGELQRDGGHGMADVIARKAANFDPQYPGLSIAVVPMKRACADLAAADPPSTPVVGGPWTHVDPPAT